MVLLVVSLFASGYLAGWRTGTPAGDQSSGGTAAAGPYQARSFKGDTPRRDPLEVLREAQRPSGAIAVEPGSSRIVPYFANIAAIALVEEHPEDVKRCLEWYLGHLNRPDRWGLMGTVYDYRVTWEGRERPTLTYDSADSYAATFLTLLRAYVEETGDTGFVLDNLGDVKLIGSVIPALQDSDGLVWTTAARREKYLMDNCENYRGMMDYAAVLDVVGHRTEAAEVAAAAESIRAGIEDRLWNEERGSYDWAIYALRVGSLTLTELSRPSDWGRWYPDTTAQIFPVLSGLIDPGSARAVALYEKLNEKHPGWVTQAKTDPHPWSVLGYTAALMGDEIRAEEFTRATAAAYMAEEGPFSGLSWELGYHLRTLELLGLGPAGDEAPGSP